MYNYFIVKELTLSDKKQLFTTIYSLYAAGFSYTEIFKTIETSVKNKSLVMTAFLLRNGIEKGTPIRDLIMRYKKVIGVQYAMLICAGDKAGKLEDALKNILKDIERVLNLRSSLIASLTYPVLLFFMAIGVLMFCHFFFFKIFENMMTGMCPSQIMGLLISAGTKIIIVFAVILFSIIYVVKDKNLFKSAMDFITEKTFLSGLVNSIYYSGFFSVLAASYEAGMPIIEAVETASDIFRTKRARQGMQKTTIALKNGTDVTSAFLTSMIFDNYVMSMIATGEKAGRLGKTFENVSAFYEKNVQDKINTIMSLVQPVSIVVIGLLVGYIAVMFYAKLYGGIIKGF